MQLSISLSAKNWRILFAFITLFIALLSIPVTGNSQSILKKIKNKVDQRVNNNIDRQIDKTLDKAEGKSAAREASPTTETVETEGVENNESSLQDYSRFDFIPGEHILYAEDFQQDVIGELPLHWNTGGKGELVTLNRHPGNWLKMYQNSIYLTSNKKTFPENFTLEFDLILQLKNLGYTYPMFSFGIMASNDLEPNDNMFLDHKEKFQSTEIMIRPSENGSSYTYLQSSIDFQRKFTSDQQNLANIEKYYGKVSRIAMQVQGKRLRVWINGQKKFDLPMALGNKYPFNQLFFRFHSSSYKEEQVAAYVSNIKVATGKPDTRHKLVEEGKFSTTGILFDFASAVIRPESFGVLKELAGLLTEMDDIKIRIIGHTSSDGDDAANMELSKKRAEAVKQALIEEFGIDASRMVSEGRGETDPVADNNSKEGKLLNRRVEFVKS